MLSSIIRPLLLLLLLFVSGGSAVRPANAACAAALPLRIIETALPNQISARGHPVTYQLTMTNPNHCAVSGRQLLLPFDPRLQQVLDFSSPDQQTWVRAVNPDHLLVELGPLAAGSSLTLTYRLRTADHAADGALISRRAVLAATDDGVVAVANRTELRVGTLDRQLEIRPLDVSSDHVVQGSPLQLSADLFLPGEPVSFWTSDSQQQHSALAVVTADADGRVALTYDSLPAPDGPLSLIAYGQQSTFTARAVVMIGAIGSSSAQTEALPATLPNAAVSRRDLRITLAWQAAVDLDLAVVEPGGEMIDMTQPRSSTDGLLERTVDCSDPEPLHRESIAWLPAAAPIGEYRIIVRFAGSCQAVPTAVPFTLYLDVGDGIVYQAGGSINPTAVPLEALRYRVAP
jgi:hypothetical protein